MAANTESSLHVATNVVHTSIPQSILEDLCSRFLINMPEQEQEDMVRVFFQIELAHWYYIDFYCQEQVLLPTYGIREFIKIIFEKFPFINKKHEGIDKLLSSWKKYKFSVPVYGAILLNSELDKCVLVQAYTTKSSWGFPRGKLNKDESPFECAIREVLEETGFEIRQYANETNFLENSIHDHLVRLYLVPNVPSETEFKARTRGEIKDIQWFHVKDLPAHKKDSRTKENLGLNPNNFFMVVPFVKGLKKWIGEQNNVASLQQQAVQSQPENQLERLLQSEEACLNLENERIQDDQRRHEAQRRFLNQLDFWHPLRPQENTRSVKGYGNGARKQSKFPSEHDQKNTASKSFKILQRPETEETLDPGRSNSPVTTRHTPPSLLPFQESNPSDSRSLSPSRNSAFTRVAGRGSPKQQSARKADPTEAGQGDSKIGSPSGSRRFRTKKQPEAKGSSSSAIFAFSAPAFTNFRFDKEKILAAMRS